MIYEFNFPDYIGNKADLQRMVADAIGRAKASDDRGSNDMSEREGRYPRVARAVLETPWAILPATMAAIVDLIALRVQGERLSEEEVQARIGAGPPRRDAQRVGLVAVVPVYGVITPKADMFTQMSGGTSVDRLQAMFRDAMSDSSVQAVVLDVDSPGGQVDLVPELAADMRSFRGRKPVVAVANTLAASAAYWLAAQADEVVVTPSGSVGSIGVFAAHDDVSAMQEKLGVKTTLVSAGKYKTEGNPFEPLDEAARGQIQALVDEAYGMFVSDVAKGRRVSVDMVRSGFGEGRLVTAKGAVNAGMADRVDTLEATIRRLSRPPRGNGNAALVGEYGPETTAVTITFPGAAGPLRPHSTATDDGPWDGPGNKARLRNNGEENYYRSAFAWQDDSADATTKAAYKFIHHEVGADGNVGAANTNGCSQGIAVLNGGRTGTTIPDGDRQGVWDHLAKHIRDAGKDPPPLKSLAEFEDLAAESGLSFADAVEVALRAIDGVVSGAEELRSLTGPKRAQLSALIERAQQLVALPEQESEPDPLGIDAEHDWQLHTIRI
jgi:capsid assembly protease